MKNKGNFYNRTMTFKTDEELKDIVDKGHENEDYYQAAEWEIERREEEKKNPKPKPADIVKNIATPRDEKEVVESKVQDEPQSEESENTEANSDGSLQLYSNSAVFLLSMLFSTLVGGGILAWNMYKLKNYQALFSVLAFALLYTLGSSLVLQYLGSGIFYPLLINMVGAFILTEIFFKKFIGSRQFEPKAVWQPLLIILGLSLTVVAYMYYSGDPTLMELLKQNEMKP